MYRTDISKEEWKEDEHIERALKCCIKEGVNCMECPYTEFRHKDCTDRFYSDVMNLINNKKGY